MATSSITVPSGDVETVIGGRAASAAPRRRSWAWVGLLPFFGFLAMFLLYPTVTVFGQALSGGHLSAMREAITGQYQRSFLASVKLSLVTAILGGILAYALATLERPKFLRSGAIAFSGVAANLGGLPLAFAFIATLGAQGLATKILKTGGIDLISHGITVYSFWGLVIVYLYFQ